ncbi:porin [Lysobacter sp. TY2-98]|uniref:OprO/OprP family phosphate-selective porin n=1 Tax=Lysobacter sp. TY2-98 TaxID=2290922 RepID=UPI000E20402E|nr:OprO/OprP family phosphate-selective porin [Lysobacter sp. TY2-98]AXK72007.1 porin [Lysobacter sp. TY2-98]
MKLSRNTLALALLGVLAAPAAHAEVAIDVIHDSEVSFEGLVQADANWYNEDKAFLGANSNDGVDHDFDMRRAELVLKGKGPGNYDWVLGYDAKANKWLDVNAKYKLGGDANKFIQIGQFKMPNSLEELSSTKNNDFIAKASITNTFGVSRRLGGQFSYGDTNWSVTGAYFERELTRNLAHGNGYGLRGTWAPINDGDNIVHLGLSYVDLDTDTDTIRLRARPLADLAGTRLVDTGATGIRNSDREAVLGLEGLWAHGPFKLQGEYMKASVDRYDTGFAAQPGSSFDADGYYISGVWNITGEKFGYKAGVPTTPLPANPASGMFQLGLRYDHIDLDDGSLTPGATPTSAPTVNGVLGGRQNAWTIGANWYWHSNFKFMLNYVKVDSSRYIGKTSATYSADPALNNKTFNAVVDDNPDIIEARVQFYW